jgi:acylphosphatase
MKAFLARISGRVQGVWFRASTREQARRIGVDGWVRNLPDGSVEVFMQGEDEKVDRLLSWCYQGPPGAHVLSVDYSDVVIDQTVKGFSIRH